MKPTSRSLMFLLIVAIPMRLAALSQEVLDLVARRSGTQVADIASTAQPLSDQRLSKPPTPEGASGSIGMPASTSSVDRRRFFSRIA